MKYSQKEIENILSKDQEVTVDTPEDILKSAQESTERRFLKEYGYIPTKEEEDSYYWSLYQKYFEYFLENYKAMSQRIKLLMEMDNPKRSTKALSIPPLDDGPLDDEQTFEEYYDSLFVDENFQIKAEKKEKIEARKKRAIEILLSTPLSADTGFIWYQIEFDDLYLDWKSKTLKESKKLVGSWFNPSGMYYIGRF